VVNLFINDVVSQFCGIFISTDDGDKLQWDVMISFSGNNIHLFVSKSKLLVDIKAIFLYHWKLAFYILRLVSYPMTIVF